MKIYLKKYEILEEGYDKGNYFYKNIENENLFFHDLKRNTIWLLISFNEKFLLTEMSLNYYNFKDILKYFICKKFKINENINVY